ncbi:glycine-rich domain-containing protein [Cytobacillus dafuensis]|uniref:Uncharacterized protein n=1 Tax=Cytobacillus dafuensis TaxID=1742359 RepID=A0A5B8Z433_CYTDA|nr:hypothetical protein [Cytobacillus dafuensis]QED47864.1 hypothetical protein FSZ17_11730 [Cytobacillus dafuensis]
MVGLIIFLIIIFFIFLLIKKRKKKNLNLRAEAVPSYLGILIEEGKPIVKHLHSSLHRSYKKNVKERMLQNHPNWKDHDFEWRYLELKKYFVLNSLIKSVPMFSEAVDEVWHEMLMFTKDYEKFSQNFYKDFLHHTPNLNVTPIPGERAYFDWVYLSLFQPKKNSQILWGGFLKYPIKQDILQNFKNQTEDELLKMYFRDSDDWIDVKKYLIQKMKTEINQSENMIYNKRQFPFTRLTSESDLHLLLPAAVFFSMYETNQFEQHMSELIPQQLTKSAGGSSSCSGFGCIGSDSNSDGGSSCSSCGGGCSS